MGKKRQIDKDASLQRYYERIDEMDDEHFECFRDAYISTFEIFSTAEHVDRGSDMDCFAATLLRLVRDRGIPVKGITSERTSGGQYICTHLLNGELRENERIVYVGKFSYFSNHQRSIFAPLAKDNVYLCVQGESGE